MVVVLLLESHLAHLRLLGATTAILLMAASKKEKIVVIGSGPCGLGAAWRLQELGHEDFTVLEAAPVAGGLSITATDENGFLWDMGTYKLWRMCA